MIALALFVTMHYSFISFLDPVTAADGLHYHCKHNSDVIHTIRCCDLGLGMILLPQVHVTMLTELLYPLQDGDTSLHLAAREGHTTYVERLLSTAGIDVNIKDRVSWLSV